MEDNDRRYARDAYQLTAMLHSRRVHVLAGRRTLLGDPLRPSRLLLATSGETLARRVKAYLGAAEAGAAGGGVAVAGGLAPGAAAPDATADHTGESAFSLPPERVISLPEVPTSLSVTEFASVLSNPYGWALGYAIGGDVVDDAQRELDPLRFGTLAHRVLELFGRTPASASAEVADVTAALDACLDEYVARSYGAVFPAVRLQVEQLRLRLHAFAVHQARRVADGWRTVAVEYGTPEGGVPLPVDGAEFRVRGRIDRIDYHAATGAWAVLDYKTGERGDGPDVKHRKRDEWLDLQLPLYRHILPHVVDREGNRAFTGGDDADVRLGYILLCSNPDEIRFAEVQWTQQELEAAMNAARDVVATIRRNVFAFPGLDSGWYDDDTAEMLGRGRLMLADDDDVAPEEEAP
jgi:ATP-dependent helicase/nuclease subunit B